MMYCVCFPSRGSGVGVGDGAMVGRGVCVGVGLPSRVGVRVAADKEGLLGVHPARRLNMNRKSRHALKRIFFIYIYFIGLAFRFYQKFVIRPW